MFYDITLRIEYVYDHDADSSRHMVRLYPADLPGKQRPVAANLTVQPKPGEWINRFDYFGNNFIELAFTEAHHEIAFTVQSRVEMFEASPLFDMSPRLSELGRDIAAQTRLEPWSPHNFTGPSPRVVLNEATRRYAQEVVGGDPNTLQAVRAIGTALHRDMRFDPEATTVDTPMLEAFHARNGVCQDFTHIMISCLRGIGIPAGYVSGFLRTIPPPGQPRMEGADAMHAWVRAWCGSEIGWVEYDPTNAVAANTDHVVIARGRDYSDIAPVRGVMRSYGDHKTTQSVDVVPVE
ncbi:MAG: transglutaminase [Rhizobiaceae bacterium MnEN-MB40S]|nr:MAG: transglutaminase [Rhizobiaceae bacterium MnEN-MB40S]